MFFMITKPKKKKRERKKKTKTEKKKRTEKKEKRRGGGRSRNPGIFKGSLRQRKIRKVTYDGCSYRTI